MFSLDDTDLFRLDDLFDEEHLGLLGHVGEDGHLFDAEPVSLPSLTAAANATATATATSADQTPTASLKGKQKVARKAGKKKKQRKKETKKKLLSSKTPSDKPPKRPLSAYNIFFKYERQKMLWPDKKHDPLPSKPDLAENDELGGRVEPRKKIGFAELAKTISARWNSLDDASRLVYQKQAELEQQRYRREISAWEELQLNKEIHRKKDECKALPTTKDPVINSTSKGSILAVSCPGFVHIMPKTTFSSTSAASTGTTMLNAHLNFHNPNIPSPCRMSQGRALLLPAPSATPCSAPGIDIRRLHQW